MFVKKPITGRNGETAVKVEELLVFLLSPKIGTSNPVKPSGHAGQG
jgi:hypothetical protein